MAKEVEKRPLSQLLEADKDPEEPAKKSRKKWKKPKDKPKRPLSAYNLFFRDERERLIVSQGCKDGKPKNVGFAALAKHIGGKWKDLDDDSKKRYTVPAEIEQVRYKVELEAWKRKQQAINEAWQCNDDPKNETSEQTLDVSNHSTASSPTLVSECQKLDDHTFQGPYQLVKILPSPPKDQPQQQKTLPQQQAKQLHHHRQQLPNWMLPLVYREMELIRKVKRAEEEKEDAIRQLDELRRQMHINFSGNRPQQTIPRNDECGRVRSQSAISANELDAAKELVSFRQKVPDTTSNGKVQLRQSQIEHHETFQTERLQIESSSKKRQLLSMEQKSSLPAILSNTDYSEQRRSALNSLVTESNAVGKNGYHSHLLPSCRENNLLSLTAAEANKTSTSYPLRMVAGLDPRTAMYYKDTTNLVKKLRMMERAETNGMIINCGANQE